MSYDHVNPTDTQHSIVYKAGQVRASYHNQNDVVATLFHCWTATSHEIRSIDASNSTLTLLRSPHVDIARCEHASGKRFYIENAIEELSEGEFYYDRVSRVLTCVVLNVPHTVVCTRRGCLPFYACQVVVQVRQ